MTQRGSYKILTVRTRKINLCVSCLNNLSSKLYFTIFKGRFLTYLQKILEFVKIQKEDENLLFPFEPRIGGVFLTHIVISSLSIIIMKKLGKTIFKNIENKIK